MAPADLPDATAAVPGPADAQPPRADASAGRPERRDSPEANSVWVEGREERRQDSPGGTLQGLMPRPGQLLGEGRGEAARGSWEGSRDRMERDDAAADDGQATRQLHPLPRGLVELYGLLAVLFVLVPEWMASGALFGFREGREGSELPAPSGAWKRLPELRLASLNLAELRQLAREQGVIGYSRQSRPELSARLLRRLKAKP